MSRFNPYVSLYEKETCPWQQSAIIKQKQEFDGLVRQLFNVEVIIVEKCYNLGVAVYTPKTRDEMLDEAKQYADAVWAKWLHKMDDKLEKMHVTSIQFSGDNPLNNTLVVESILGITFDLKNSVIIKWSERCGYFNQFPARFTNVRQHGVKMLGLAKQYRLAEYIESEVQHVNA